MTDRYLFRGFHPCENGAESVWTCGKEIKGKWIQGNNVLLANKGARAFIVPKGEYVEEVLTRDKRLLLIAPQVEVLPETVGQYTGLNDKNGNMIFENDVLQIWEQGEEYNYKVIYNAGCFMLAMVDSMQGSYPLSVKHTQTEVIGSIHANPDILERKEGEE